MEMQGKVLQNVAPTSGRFLKIANFQMKNALEDNATVPINIDSSGIFLEKILAADKIRVNNGVVVLKTRSLAL